MTDASGGEQSTKKSPRCIIEAGLANHSKDNGGISIWTIIV